MNKKLLTLLSCTGISLVSNNQAKAIDLLQDDVLIEKKNYNKLTLERCNNNITNEIIDDVNGCCGNGGCTCNGSCR